MPLRTKFVLASLILISPAVILGATSMYLLDKISKPLHQDIPQQVAKLSKSSKLGEKALYIRYYDEVLTQSARNYAYTGNVAWILYIIQICANITNNTYETKTISNNHA